MGYSAVPFTKILENPHIAWYLYACGVTLLLVAAVMLAASERRERRRLARALPVARQVSPFRKGPVASRPFRPDIERHNASHRFWLFPLVAMLLGLIVGVWSIWNVLAG